MTPYFDGGDGEIILDVPTFELACSVICYCNVDRSRRGRRICITVMSEVFAEMAAGKRLVLLGPYGIMIVPQHEWQRVPLAEAEKNVRESFLASLQSVARYCGMTFDPASVCIVR